MRKLWLGAALTACCAPGCFRAPESLVTTELDDQDLEAMTRKMAESIARCPHVVSQAAPPIVVLFRIRNETNQVIGQIYLHRVRVLLAKHASSKMVFVLSKAAWRELAAGEGRSWDERYRDPRLVPTLALMGTFYAHTIETAAGRSDYIFCSFQLVHLQAGAILWEDYYNVKRAATRRRFD